MDLRTLPDGLTPADRCDYRRQLVEKELGTDLSALQVDPATLGHAEERNCENMIGSIPLPVGICGPLPITFSSGKETNVHPPLATTEGALVASVNRGCKALAVCGSVKTSSVYHGITRSLAWRVENGAADGVQECTNWLEEQNDQWREIGEKTSDHLKIQKHWIDVQDQHVFLTIACHTDEAMGMNMATIAAQAIGDWVSEQRDDLTFITVAGNVDSDKKPSQRTHDLGRGYEVTAEVELTEAAITDVLKSTPEMMLAAAQAKLEAGSKLAGAIGANLHAANVIAALYLATGQDAAHVVEGSLADTRITNNQSPNGDSLVISTRLPAVLIGVRGGGTTLPAQAQCLDLLLKEDADLHPCQQLAETIGAAVLAGEVSLLAAQASHQLAKAHSELGR